MMDLFLRLWMAFDEMRQQGQGLVEYALIVALIAIVTIVALLFLGSQISAILSAIAEQL